MAKVIGRPSDETKEVVEVVEKEDQPQEKKSRKKS